MRPVLSSQMIVVVAIAAVAVWSALAGTAWAQDADGQFPSYSVIVLESDDPEIDARQVYTSAMPGDDGQDKPVVFEIPAGKSLKIMKPSGAIETYAGPQSVKVADLMDFSSTRARPLRSSRRTSSTATTITASWAVAFSNRPMRRRHRPKRRQRNLCLIRTE